MNYPTPRRIYKRAISTLHEIDVIRESVINWPDLRPDLSRNPLTAVPRRYWSQADEDGILEQILTRIGPNSNGVFLEFGVGDGTVCNTLVLLARGWKGGWIGNEELAFDPEPAGRLVFQQGWITRSNVGSLSKAALSQLGLSWDVAPPEIDVVSLDLDGNDFHLTKVLLEAGIRPSVWISEYNAKFPVGVNWVMPYDDNHAWAQDDYYGASISAFASLFSSYGYFPVACSAQGANVFFVRSEFTDAFTDVPHDLNLLYQPLLAVSKQEYHPVSRRTLETLTSAREQI